MPSPQNALYWSPLIEFFVLERYGYCCTSERKLTFLLIGLKSFQRMMLTLARDQLTKNASSRTEISLAGLASIKVVNQVSLLIIPAMN